MSKKRGIVKWFNRLKGFGFVEPEDGSADIFVHYSTIDGEGYRNLSDEAVPNFDEVDQGKSSRTVSNRSKRHR